MIFTPDKGDQKILKTWYLKWVSFNFDENLGGYGIPDTHLFMLFPMSLKLKCAPEAKLRF